MPELIFFLYHNHIKILIWFNQLSLTVMLEGGTDCMLEIGPLVQHLRQLSDTSATVWFKAICKYNLLALQAAEPVLCQQGWPKNGSKHRLLQTFLHFFSGCQEC